MLVSNAHEIAGSAHFTDGETEGGGSGVLCRARIPSQSLAAPPTARQCLEDRQALDPLTAPSMDWGQRVDLRQASALSRGFLPPPSSHDRDQPISQGG